MGIDRFFPSLTLNLNTPWDKSKEQNRSSLSISALETNCCSRTWNVIEEQAFVLRYAQDNDTFKAITMVSVLELETHRS